MASTPDAAGLRLLCTTILFNSGSLCRICFNSHSLCKAARVSRRTVQSRVGYGSVPADSPGRGGRIPGRIERFLRRRAASDCPGPIGALLHYPDQVSCVVYGCHAAVLWEGFYHCALAAVQLLLSSPGRCSDGSRYLLGPSGSGGFSPSGQRQLSLRSVRMWSQRPHRNPLSISESRCS